MNIVPRVCIMSDNLLRRHEWIWIAVAAVLLRAIIFAAVCLHAHLAPGDYARLYDGRSYIITAQAMTGDRTEFNDYHGRVFPGYPAIIAVTHLTGVPFTATAVAIDWLTAAAAAVFAAMLFTDRRIGWAMVMLIPHYLMNSAMALSEAPLLAFTLGGLLLVRRSRPTSGGVLIGIAGLIRPMACFALIGCGFAETLRRRFISSGIMIAAAGLVVFAGLLLVGHWRGDAFASARYYANSPNTYDGQLLTWPFHALLTVPADRHVPIARVAYIWAHAVIALIACGVMLWRFTQHPRNLDLRDALAGPWLWSNTLFALCTGSVWGFECFHRFTIPALPAMFWAIRRVLPQKNIGWILVAAVSTLIAVLTILRDQPVISIPSP
jgi:hypothetical protein